MNKFLVFRFIYCVVAWVVLAYVWMTKIIYQYLIELRKRLETIQEESETGVISLTELILLSKLRDSQKRANNNKDDFVNLDNNSPVGLIEQIDCIQYDYSFHIRKQISYYFLIRRLLEPRVLEWEHEINKRKSPDRKAK